MISNRLKITGLTSIFLLFLASACGNRTTKPGQPEMITYTNEDGFSFDLPDNCLEVTGNDLGLALRGANPAIIFAAIVDLPEEKVLISVSAYDLNERMSIDSAFKNNLQYRPTLAGEPVGTYRVVDYGAKESEDRKLCYKISFNPETKYSIIYYAMKNNYSNILYELKATCEAEERLPEAKRFIEKVALSSRFEDR